MILARSGAAAVVVVVTMAALVAAVVAEPRTPSTVPPLPTPRSLPPFQPKPLSPFQKAKAEALLHGKLPCLGCHELDGQGGRIGPSLSSLNSAQTPEYVYAKIKDPRGLTPASIMPRVPLGPASLELVASYLVQRQPKPPAQYVPLATSTPPPPDDGTGATLYRRWCAHCHGPEGQGDGPNARFLPVRPVAHASAPYMATRSDDALFDAISVGGRIMNRSVFMPAYGQTLTRAEIRALVRHLRSLCQCEGPAWSRDRRQDGR